MIFAAHDPLEGRVGATRFSLGLRDALLLAPEESAALELAGRWLDTQLVPAG